MQLLPGGHNLEIINSRNNARHGVYSRYQFLLSKFTKVMQIFSVLMVWNTGAFSIDRLCCLLFAFVVFTVGLSTLDGEAKTQEDFYLVLAGGPS